MKKIALLIILMVSTISLLSHSAYYYSRGKRIPITENNEYVTLALPMASSVARAYSTEMQREIGDTLFKMAICEKTSRLSLLASVGKVRRNDLSDAILLPSYKTANGSEIFMTPYLNIRLKKESDYPLLEQVASEYNLVIDWQDEFLPLWYVLHIVDTTKGTSLDIANEIYESGLFAEALADFTSEDYTMCSYDPLVLDQWHLYNPYYENVDISISKAWSYATGMGIKIGILDQGVDKKHEDLKQNIDTLSFNTMTGKSPSVCYNQRPHGTHCAGIAAASRNNGLQIAGVAPDARIVSISNTLVADDNSQLKRADGIVWAYKNGVDIISNSWGCGSEHAAIDEAIDSAFKYGRNGKGCIITFSVGNAGNNVPIAYPANCNEKILAVGAIDSIGNLYNTTKQGSQTGEGLDVVAPGVNILSTVLKNGVARMSGTSMACPQVAGLAALILERNPNLTVSQVNDIIERNTKKIGSIPYDQKKKNGTWNSHYGYGLIDAYKAIMATPLPK